MAGAAIAGKKGKVRVTGTPDTDVALLTEWSVDISHELYDSTTLGDDWKTDVPGLREWSGSCSGYFDVEDDMGQTILHNSILNGVALTLELEVEGPSIYVGKVHPTTVAVGNPLGGLVTFAFSFKGSGQLLFS